MQRATAAVTRPHLPDMSDGGGVCFHLPRTMIEPTLRPRSPTTGVSPAPDGGECELATGDELRRLVLEWSGKGVAFHCDSTLAAAFEATVARAPDRIAISTETGEHLTYVALNERANRVAHHLRSRNIGHGSVVGLFVERTELLIIGMLGIVKSGAAYLPMDLSSPRERTAFILRDAGAAMVVTSAATHDLLDADAAPVLRLDTDWPLLMHQPTTNPDAVATPDSLAYVIFTSGSTGTPKGCEVSHVSVLRLFAACDAWFGFGEHDVFAQFHSHAFDVSVFEIWGALLHGARLVLLSANTCRTPELLLARLERESVTVLCQTPSAFRQLSAMACAAKPVPALKLRRLVLAGEALELQSLRPWVERFGDESPHLLNMYGPTEATVYVSYRRIRAVDIEQRRGSVIGVPLPDTRFHILDAEQRVCAIGVAGEMYLGGAGLARGYLNRAALTAERFVWCAPGDLTAPQRLYRTGDLARWTPAGEVEYLGRLDAQVKVRGYRIELGEIEATLGAHAGVSDCAVIAQQRPEHGPRLVAYVVPSATPVTIPTLRAYLHRTLPDYMVPSAVVELHALSLNSNGKLDRGALPAPERGRPEVSTVHAAPVGEVERTCCAIFAEFLQLDAVGRHDNFFELGGDSLLAVQAVAALGRELDRPVSVAMLFANASPRVLAASLGAPDAQLIEAQRRSRGSEPIAIIAMAARLPGADTVEEFWQVLDDGRDTLTRFSPEQLDASIPISLRRDPAYVPVRSVLRDPEGFDAAFFGMSQRDASLLDPQQRLLLELSWESLERAGYAPKQTVEMGQVVGVFAGVYSSEYSRKHVYTHPELVERAGDFQVMLGTDKDYVATHIAHRLNLTGPAISVQTACSTSLVAIAQAVESLRAGQCTMAIAGGAAITYPHRSGHLYVEGAMLSKDGRTRTFDAEATGTVFGDGGAVVVLKRLRDAIDEGDVIHAVIRGVAVNNDGGRKASFTAPSVDGQTAVIIAAQADAGVSPRSVSYIEAHGTATPLGDPIEVEALTRAFRRGSDGTEETAFCRIGSAKSNVGHMVSAAGAVGVLKTVLALQHEVLPPTLHFSTPNPQIDFARTPFLVAATRTDWPRTDTPRRAGVSSFGVGGTNAHVVLEEAPRRPTMASRPGPHLLRLSARSPGALEVSRRALAAHLSAMPDLALADVAATLRSGRETLQHRACVVARDTAEAVTLLDLETTAGVPTTTDPCAADLTTAIEEARRWLAAEDDDPRILTRHQRVVLPTTPFERVRCWLDAAVTTHRTPVLPPSPDGGAAAERAARITPLPPPDVIFTFPGQGSQYAQMGEALYHSEPVFRDACDTVFASLTGVTSFDLRATMFGGSADALTMTAVTQPATFCLEYALATLWRSRGLRPRALIGHSIGEFAAAVIAGIMTVPEASRLVARRGAMMNVLSRGSMLSVRLPARDLAVRLPAALAIAAENGPSSCVVSGTTQAIDAFARALEQTGVLCRKLQTSHAFHSSMMDPMLDAFGAEVRRVALAPPSVPIISTRTGTWLTHAEALDPGYWTRHLRETVRFSAAVETALRGARSVFLEIGPQHALSTLVKQHRSAAQCQQVPATVASLGDGSASERDSFVAAVGQLRLHGIEAGPPDPVGRTVPPPPPTPPLDERQNGILAPSTFPALMSQHATRRLVLTPRGSTPVGAVLREPTPARFASIESRNEPSLALVAGAASRRATLVGQLRALIQSIGGVELNGAPTSAAFIELGLDSLVLTQVAIQVQKTFGVRVTFRQMVEQYRSLDALASHLEASLPPEPAGPVAAPTGFAACDLTSPALVEVRGDVESLPLVEQVIQRQLAIMEQQLALLGRAPVAAPGVLLPVASRVAPAGDVAHATAPVEREIVSAASAPRQARTDGERAPAEDAALIAHTRYDVQKAFGAIARIHTESGSTLTDHQRQRLDTFIRSYTTRTQRSKAYTAHHRAHLADPRVVNGFRPQTKELCYQIVVERSKGSRLWDIDGNEYIDALNGFGVSLCGWQPDFVTEAVKAQIDRGHDIGPQHPLAGEVASLVCELTGFDRAALCNTGSEAVIGAIRIARTVTARDLIVCFTGSYHGIFDEVLVRGTRTGRAVPAAPGVVQQAVENVLVLDYGAPESLAIIRERAHEIAAVLVEPVQSRRPDFQPVGFLRELRVITAETGTVLIFDEVITGFRSHQRGAQGLFDIRADLATYGKVIGGGYPVGVIAGRRALMDALDGGAWQYGDDSIPGVGVTYFAGTFVRHPLALAACKATLAHLRDEGPALQQSLTAQTGAMAAEMNAWARASEAPLAIRHFASLWRITFTEEHPLQDLLWAMMRHRGIHILDNFPCFLTTAHSAADIASIVTAFREALTEMQTSGFLPGQPPAQITGVVSDASRPPVPNARLGRDRDGSPAWFVPDSRAPGQYVQLDASSAA